MWIRQIKCPCSFKFQFEATSVTEVADGERRIHMLIIYTSRFPKKNTPTKGSFFAQRQVWEFLSSNTSSRKEHLMGWNVIKDAGPQSISGSWASKAKKRKHEGGCTGRHISQTFSFRVTGRIHSLRNHETLWRLLSTKRLGEGCVRVCVCGWG